MSIDDFYSIIGQQISKCWPVFTWPKEHHDFIERRKAGQVRYKKPPKNRFKKAHSKPQLNRRLCTAAYR